MSPFSSSSHVYGHLCGFYWISVYFPGKIPLGTKPLLVKSHKGGLSSHAEFEWPTCVAYKCFPKVCVQIGVDEILSLSMISIDKYTVVEFYHK